MVSVFITILSATGTVLQNGAGTPYKDRNCTWGVSLIFILMLAYSAITFLRICATYSCYIGGKNTHRWFKRKFHILNTIECESKAVFPVYSWGDYKRKYLGDRELEVDEEGVD